MDEPTKTATTVQPADPTTQETTPTETPADPHEQQPAPDATPAPDPSGAAAQVTTDEPPTNEPPAQPSEVAKPGTDGSAASSSAAAQVEQLEKALTEKTAEAAAAKLGVRHDRIGYVIKMADLGGIDIKAEDSAGKVQAAIEKVVSDLPELMGGAGTGGTGNFARKATGPQAEVAETFSAALDGR